MLIENDEFFIFYLRVVVQNRDQLLMRQFLLRLQSLQCFMILLFRTKLDFFHEDQLVSFIVPQDGLESVGVLRLNGKVVQERVRTTFGEHFIVITNVGFQYLKVFSLFVYTLNII